jgi:hypothetical protein
MIEIGQEQEKSGIEICDQVPQVASVATVLML